MLGYKLQVLEPELRRYKMPREYASLAVSKIHTVALSIEQNDQQLHAPGRTASMQPVTAVACAIQDLGTDQEISGQGDTK